MHSTLRAAVARHTKPQPLSRTAILVRTLALCGGALADAHDRPRQRRRWRKRQRETLTRSHTTLLLLQLLQLLSELAARVHAHQDIGPANKLAGDEHLRNGGPVAALARRAGVSCARLLAARVLLLCTHVKVLMPSRSAASCKTLRLAYCTPAPASAVPVSAGIR